MPVEEGRPDLPLARSSEPFGQSRRRTGGHGPGGAHPLAGGRRLRRPGPRVVTASQHRMSPRKRLPGGALADRTQCLVTNPAMQAASHLVAVGDQRVDLEVAEPIEIGADARHLRLHDGVDSMRIDVRIGDVRRRQKREAVAVAEVLPLQLPDAIPEDVGGSNRLGNEPQWSVAENVKWLAGVAHDDAVVGAAAVLGEPGKCPRAQVVVDPAVGEGLGRKLPLMHAQVVRRDLHRGKEPGKGRRGAHHLREACGLAGHVPERIDFPLLPLLEV